MSDNNSSSKPQHQVGDFSWMNETLGRKSFWDRAKEDPLVPIGCALTAAVLLGGLITFHQGKSRLGNRFMQARVVAQTGTVMAMGLGAMVAAKNGADGHGTKNNHLSYEERTKLELRKLD